MLILTHWLCDFPQSFLRPCHQVSSLHQVFVEPLSSDDWEILVGDTVTCLACLHANMQYFKYTDYYLRNMS